jgi:hypothetical protein
MMDDESPPDDTGRRTWLDSPLLESPLGDVLLIGAVCAAGAAAIWVARAHLIALVIVGVTLFLGAVLFVSHKAKATREWHPRDYVRVAFYLGIVIALGALAFVLVWASVCDC